MSKKVALLLNLLILIAMVVPVVAQDKPPFSLTILHTNDTHAAHEPNSSGNGGAARQATVVNQIRNEVDNVLLLDGGDRFTGTLFHQQYRGEDQIQIMNLLGYDGMTLGNHEFDDGEAILERFVTGLNFPVVSANVDFTAFPAIDEKVDPYTIVEVGGEQIGIIGLTTPETPEISKASADVVFNSDLVAVTEAAVAELTASGVNKIILLTHTGVAEDMILLPQMNGVDIYIGGHSHTLFSNTYAAAGENKYPFVGETEAGEPIVYVQAGSNNQYLGRLDVQFDAAGLLTRYSGDTILLSKYIAPNAEMAGLIAKLAGPIEELKATAIGAEASILLVGDRAVCRVEECGLGDLITDAMRAETGAQIAITNGGGIRASIDVGEITLGEVLTVLPFGNLTSTFELTGADVIAALENGVSQILVEDGMVVREGAAGRFPQVSGIRFTYDPTLESGSRIVSVEVLGADGEYTALDEGATYTVASNDFMRGGGDGYSVIKENAINPYDFGRPLDQVLADYLAANTPVAPEAEGRITVVNAELAPLE